MEGRDAHALLSEEPFIRYHRKAFSGQLVDRYLKDNNLFPRQRLEIDSLLTIVSLVERGVGVSLVPDSFSISYRERQLIKLRSEEHTSELQSLMRISYAVFCLKKKNRKTL